MPRIRYKVTLTRRERQELEEITTRGRHSSQKMLNALILLRCDEGRFQKRKMTNQAIAALLPVSMKKIDRVKRRFVEEGLEAALDKRKAERSHTRKADGDFEAHLVALSCSKPPPGHARWSLRLLADRMMELQYVDGISHETVRRVLKNELKPWKKRQWVIPPGGRGEFVARMEQVLDVYRRPCDPRYPVICMDESPRQLIRETRAPLPAGRGRAARYDYEYERRECVLGGGTPDRSTHGAGEGTTDQDGLGVLPPGQRPSLAPGGEDHARHGQSEHARIRLAL